MSDETTTLADLRRVVAEFVAERDWEQFHTPKNLSMALAVEVAELMEHFQWVEPSQVSERLQSEEVRKAVTEEVADVCCYLLSLANALQIDLSTAVEQKMIRNRAKYPAERYRGRFEEQPPASQG